MTKRCGKCHETLPANAFSLNRGRTNGNHKGLQSYCKACRAIAWAQKPRRLRRAKNLFYKYGLSWDDYVAMWRGQNRRCAICEARITLAGAGRRVARVDHCHLTGRRRKLVCDPCNVLLGMAKDNVSTLLVAAEYICLHRGAS